MFYKRWRDFVGLVLLILVGGLWVVLNHSNFFFLSTLQCYFVLNVIPNCEQSSCILEKVLTHARTHACLPPVGLKCFQIKLFGQKSKVSCGVVCAHYVT